MTSAHENLRDLLAAYALDAIDGTERIRIRSHLESCTECRAELRELLEVAANLAAATAEPDPRVPADAPDPANRDATRPPSEPDPAPRPPRISRAGIDHRRTRPRH